MTDHGNYTDFEILPNGNLKISLTPEGKIELENQMADDNQWDYPIIDSLIEHQLCNGWTWLPPDSIEALTDSPLLSNDVSYNEYGDMELVNTIWWYPNYQVENLAEKLLENGYLIFTKS